MRARPRSTRSLSTLPAPCAPTPIPTSARLSPTREAHIPVLASGQAAPVTVPMSLEPPDTCHHFSLAFCRHGRGELQLDAAGGVRGGAHIYYDDPKLPSGEFQRCYTYATIEGYRRVASPAS